MERVGAVCKRAPCTARLPMRRTLKLVPDRGCSGMGMPRSVRWAQPCPGATSQLQQVLWGCNNVAPASAAAAAWQAAAAAWQR